MAEFDVKSVRFRSISVRTNASPHDLPLCPFTYSWVYFTHAATGKLGRERPIQYVRDEQQNVLENNKKLDITSDTFMFVSRA